MDLSTCTQKVRKSSSFFSSSSSYFILYDVARDRGDTKDFEASNTQKRVDFDAKQQKLEFSSFVSSQRVTQTKRKRTQRAPLVDGLSIVFDRRRDFDERRRDDDDDDDTFEQKKKKNDDDAVVPPARDHRA